MWTEIIEADAVKWMRQRANASIDMVFGSPPYAEKGKRYGPRAEKWRTDDWVPMMADATVEACRISRGYVLWVVNGAVRQRRYHPACEGLVWEAYRRGIVCERPVIWHKNAPPNRNGDWFSNAWEFVVAFKPSGCPKPYFDWEAVADPPKYKSGGDFCQRGTNGQRRRGSTYPTNELALPRDVVRVTVGGGHLGHPLAHENEAPFPVKLAKHFVATCCPLGGTVLDPFFGSGTTGQACAELGRSCIGIDIRESQCQLAERRLAVRRSVLR